MAIMNKMREKMTVIFAGLAGAFLLMIIFEWGAQGDFFRKGQRTGDAIGEVNGMPIPNKDYQDMYQRIRQQKLDEKKASTLTDAEEAEVSDKAWDAVITDKLIDQKLKDYDITITDQEVRDRLYYNPPQDIRRSFTDSSGRFRQQEYWSTLRDPRYDTVVAQIATREREELKREKLQGMLFSAIRLTNSEMWERFDIQNAKAVTQVVKIAPPSDSYRDIVKTVTDDEMKKYYEDHKWQFKSEEGKKVKLVIFRELPTARDSALAIDHANSLAQRWKSLPLTESDSSLGELAREYSDLGFQKAAPLTQQSLAEIPNTDSLLMHSAVGDIRVIVGKGQIKVIRVSSIADSGDVQYHFKQIFLGAGRNPVQQQSPDSINALADKIMSQLRSGADFASLAQQYSMDPSARAGGDMGWLTEKMSNPAVMAEVKKAPLNQLVGPIHTEIGTYIIMVMGHTSRKLTIQTIPLEIKSSSQTSKMVQQQANIFREQALKKGFDQAAKDMDQRVITNAPLVQRKSQQPIFGYKPWTTYILDLGVGDISEPVKIPGAKIIVVAQVTESVPKGYQPLEGEVKRSIQSAVTRQKMVESVAAKAKQLRGMIGAGEGLEKLASVDTNYKIISVTMGPGESTQELGEEYAVNTAAFYQLKPGEISQPIKGSNAYYIVKLVDLRPSDKALYDKQKPKLFESLTKEKEERFFGKWVENLKDNAMVKDYRIGRF